MALWLERLAKGRGAAPGPPRGPTRPDVICLHGPKLSAEAVRVLSELFDEVVLVPMGVERGE